MNRKEHLQWCKDRALKYVDAGDNRQAMASMMSDIQKHEGTGGDVQRGFSLGIMAIQSGNDDEMRRFINGFN